jgi:superkiller protein 3
MLPEPTCYKRQCKWYVGVIRPEGTETTEAHFCGAFPAGIPSEIAYGKNRHANVFEGQAKPYTYQKSKDWEHNLDALPPEDLKLWQAINEEGQEKHERQEDDLATLRGLALDLVNTRQWERARLIGEYLTVVTPDEPRARMLLGIACMETNDLAKAEEQFLASVELDQEGELAHNFIFMARVCGRRADFARQLYWAEKATDLMGEEESYFAMAEAYRNLGRWNDAEATLKEFIDKNPDNAGARSRLGRVYLSSGALAEAVEQFVAAADLESDNASLWADLGCAVKRMGKYGSALAAFHRALALEPENPLRNYDLGDTYLALNDHDRAIAFLSKAAELDPDYALAHYNLGLAFLESGKYEESLRASTAALRNDPDMTDQQTNLGLGAVTNLAVAYLRQEKYREAEDALERNLKLFAPTYYNLGLAQFRQRRYKDALVNLQRAVDIEPADPECLDMLGNAYGELGMLEEAEEAFRRAIEVDAQYPLGHYDLGWILAKTESRQKEALASFKRALALDEDLPWAYYSIACIYALWGRKKAALAFFEKALQKGLDDRAHIDGDSDLDGLRNDPKFRDLMERHFPIDPS